ncbi:MAG: Gfo/Idh/MocA family oxidoreductase [Flavobacteriaceae bacterium]|nr:Gfo/Idh/MocA family oxidoreductase [Flavobacteriaceae bacterium]
MAGTKNFRINRRKFLQGGMASLVISQFGAYGFDLIYPIKPWKVGVIGTGWYGKSDLFRLMQVTQVEVVAICDVDIHLLNEAADLISQRQKTIHRPKLYENYQKMIDENELDIVIIGTPDHWHALQTIHSLQAGAHVYVQKPISVDVLEGHAMIRAAHQYNRVVQVGTQRKSTPHLIHAKEHIVDKGLLGTIGHVEMCCYYHMRAKGNPQVKPIPDFLNYDLWTGPAPWRPYDNLPHRGWWRAFMEYSNGITGDMCVHMYDTVRWLLDLQWPKKISASGGIFIEKKSKANIADTQTAIFQHDGFNCVWNHRTWGNPVDFDYPWGFFIYGEYGTLKGSPHMYEFIPRNNQPPIKKDVIYQREQFPEDLTEKDIELHAAPATRLHMIDFLEAIQTGKKPVSNLLDGHISTASCILANIAMKTNRTLVYDPQKMIVQNDSQATKLLKRPYRTGWKHPWHLS